MIGAGGAKVKKGLLNLKPASKQNKTKYCPVKRGYTGVVLFCLRVLKTSPLSCPLLHIPPPYVTMLK